MSTKQTSYTTPKAMKKPPGRGVGGSAGGGRTAASAASQLTEESEREKALREVEECLQAVRYEGFQLDGFNLLGVVANPRSGMVGGSSRHSTSSGSHPATPPRPQQQPGSTREQQQQPQTPQQAGQGDDTAAAAASAAENPPQPDIFSDAVHSLEFTLAQVAEQIETLNLFLEELSRQYLGDDGGESLFLEYYYQDEEEQQIPVPAHLANLKLTELQSYLEQCGVMAHSLFANGLETNTYQGTAAELEKEIQAMPKVFSEDDFDLTRPSTFGMLLLQEATATTDDNAPMPSKKSTTNEKDPAKKTDPAAQNSLYQPTQELVPLKEQDSLSGYLDKVELALQEQVRRKSGAFFQETTRFRQLQSLIEELLKQVGSLRKSIFFIMSVYRQTKDISNHQRQDYEQLVDLMDAAMDLVACKAAIGGLLSANDHLGAAQKIQYGRKLLKGETTRASESSKPPVELQHVTSLSNCGDQFKQYESLVVQNLSEELVDVFFHWRNSEKERVQEMVEALNLCQAFDQAGELYHRRLHQMIRMTVRTTIAEFVESNGAGGSGVTGMTYPAFYNCLQLLIEELMTILKNAVRVDEFCVAEKVFASEKRWTSEAKKSGADLAAKSIAELLRLRKEAHSLLSLNEMKQLWDVCLRFTLDVESYNDETKAVGLRSTLVGQAKAFLDRTHESNMSSLVAALDSERWTQCEVSAERQSVLTRLCTGRAIMSSSAKHTQMDESSDENNNGKAKKAMAEVEGVNYKVVWSCLLLVEMVMTNLSAAAHFQSLATNAVGKVSELLRLFNTRATQLVLGAGAIHSAARLKSINAKHLSMVTQCVGMMLSLLPHIRAALMAQLPSRQHPLLADLDRIKKEYLDHNEKVLNKFVTIIGGIVEHGLAPRIANTDFDARARDLPLDADDLACCVFLDGIATNTRKMHQVLNSLLPADHLQDVFSRIFAYVDNKVPTLIIAAAASPKTPNGATPFRFPSTEEGKRRLLLEVSYTTKKLNGMARVLPWDFTVVSVLERKLEYKLPPEDPGETEEKKEDGKEEAEDSVQDEKGGTGKEEKSKSQAAEEAEGGKGSEETDKQQNGSSGEVEGSKPHGEDSKPAETNGAKQNGNEVPATAGEKQEEGSTGD